MNTLKSTLPQGQAGHGRFGFIDAVRGIAAFIVLIQHGLEASGFIQVEGGFGSTWLNLGQAGVVAFFLVSGFVIPMGLERRGSLKMFWIGRALRLYPLYLTIFFINILILNVAGFLEKSPGSQIWLILSHLFFLQEYLGKINCVGASWTLSLEMAWYISFAGLFYLKLNRNSKLITLAGCSLLLMLACVSILANIRIPFGRLGLLLLCLMGLLFYRNFSGDDDPVSSKKKMLPLLATITIGLLVAFGYFHHRELSLFSVLSSWGLGIFIFAFFYQHRNREFTSNKILRWLGECSYSVYLVHPLIIDLLKPAQLQGVAFIAILIPLTLLISALTYNWIEKPAIALTSKLKKQATALPATP